jgi:SAM-dependent methyltransferase
MGLVDGVGAASLFACPGCRSQVVEAEAGFRCSSPACAFHAEGSFPALGRWPVLVDFEHSILQPGRLHASTGLAEPGDRRWSIDRLPSRLRRLW